MHRKSGNGLRISSGKTKRWPPPPPPSAAAKCQQNRIENDEYQSITKPEMCISYTHTHTQPQRTREWPRTLHKNQYR